MSKTYTEMSYRKTSDGLYVGKYTIKTDSARNDIPTNQLALGSTALSTTGKLYMYDGESWGEM